MPPEITSGVFHQSTAIILHTEIKRGGCLVIPWGYGRSYELYHLLISLDYTSALTAAPPAARDSSALRLQETADLLVV